MKQTAINFVDDGNELKVTLSELDLAGNREFGAVVVKDTLDFIEQTIRARPALANTFSSLLADLAVSRGELPSEHGLRFAFSWEGTKTLVDIMSRKLLPTPMPPETLAKFVQQNYREIQQSFYELLPLPKVIGPTSANGKM